MHILIVEDETKIAGFLATGLNESGYQTTQVGNGLHALSVLEQQQIDLVLLDVMLPDLDGWQVLKTCVLFLKFPYSC